MAGVHSALLRVACTLIASPETWTKGAYARTALEQRIEFDRDQAVRFCAFGALMRVAIDVRSIGRTAQYLRTPTGKTGLLFTVWHDAPERTHAEVLERFDWAIMQAEAEGN